MSQDDVPAACAAPGTATSAVTARAAVAPMVRAVRHKGRSDQSMVCLSEQAMLTVTKTYLDVFGMSTACFPFRRAVSARGTRPRRARPTRSPGLLALAEALPHGQ